MKLDQKMKKIQSQLEEASQQLEEIYKKNRCDICLSERKSRVCVPCGHQVGKRRRRI